MVKKELLVSIALCSYNGEKYIGQQLDSILNQTYKNIEIVIVDDHSTDGTFDILRRYAVEHPQIKLFRNEANLGFNKNFEKAISLASGDYIAISDQDDIWLPEKIETLLNSIGDNWLIFSNSSYIGGKPGNNLLHKAGLSFSNYKSILLANFVTGHTTLFKKEFVEHLLPFPLKGFYDWWMGFVALYHGKIIFLDMPLTQHRLHEESVMQRRLSSGEESFQQVKATSHMLSAFSRYKGLSVADRRFIIELKNAYRKTYRRKRSFSLIQLIVTNYRELFSNYKVRQGLSVLNFAFKYAGKVRTRATLNLT